MIRLIHSPAHIQSVSAPAPAGLRLLFMGPSLRTLHQQLLDHGYQGLPFETGLQAWYWLRETRTTDPETLPDAIICAAALPDIDVWALTRYFRADEMLQHIPLLVAGPPLAHHDRLHALRAGIDEWMPADRPAEDFDTRIRFLVEHKTLLMASDIRSDAGRSARFSWQRRLRDLTFASAGLLLLMPVWAPIALILRSQGPVLTRRKRVGGGYHVYDEFRFRTGPESPSDRPVPQYTTAYTEPQPLWPPDADEPAVYTGLGRWLHRTGLAGIPRLLNVLKGDISLTGNQPLSPSRAETMTTDQWAHRLVSPAGFTGYWRWGEEQLPYRYQPGQEAWMLARTLFDMLRKFFSRN
ncbi:MAG: sugar transferase [Bacteroidia bacterium]|nr:sugar transferase [Bacteroidia bacterium]